MKRHSLVAYFVLAYAITWAIGIPLAASAQGLLDVQIPPNVHFLLAYGPMLAAFIVTGIISGTAGIRELLERMTRWRVGVGWYLIAAFSPVALFLFSAAIVRATGGTWPDFSQFGNVEEFPQLGWLAVWIFWVLTFGIGEETGWRGFALPRLQKGRSAISATLMLSVFWALWHLPMFFYRPAYMNMGIAGIPMFYLSLLAGAIILTWLYNGTGGSILMVALWHGALNTGTPYSPGAIQMIFYTFIMVAAVVIVVVARPANLSRSEKQTI